MTDKSQQNTNKVTIDAYETNTKKYIDGTPHDVSGDVKEWIDEALALIKPGGKILELGSAFGRDALYMEQRGYVVQRTDATQSFVDLLIEQGYGALNLNAITDDYPSSNDMVFANAVLLHFTRNESAEVLKKAYKCLSKEGVFAFTVKKGDGEGWTDDKLDAPRYFCYWHDDSLRQLVENSGFIIASLKSGVTRNAEWLQVIAKKSA